MKTVHCSCGHLASGDTAEQLLHALEAHIDAAHAHPRAAEVRNDAGGAQPPAQYVEETIAVSAEEDR